MTLDCVLLRPSEAVFLLAPDCVLPDDAAFLLTGDRVLLRSVKAAFLLALDCVLLRRAEADLLLPAVLAALLLPDFAVLLRPDLALATMVSLLGSLTSMP